MINESLLRRTALQSAAFENSVSLQDADMTWAVAADIAARANEILRETHFWELCVNYPEDISAADAMEILFDRY